MSLPEDNALSFADHEFDRHPGRNDDKLDRYRNTEQRHGGDTGGHARLAGGDRLLADEISGEIAKLSACTLCFW